jgi:4-hydroxy-tetrahydrodipicolinate reductase
MDTIRVGVCGAAGRMGQTVVNMILEEKDLTLAMAVDTKAIGEDAALVAERTNPCGVQIEADLNLALQSQKVHVMVDFTEPNSVFNNIMTAISHHCACVVGTTGLSAQQIAKIEKAVSEQKGAVVIAPNFALGAVLLMKFAQEAARYFDHAEIIEMHHNQKVDAPSGTAFRTADLMKQSRARFGTTNIAADKEQEILLGCRGGETDSGIHIHSVRLPGLVAHQEVIFGGVGQTLTLRHDSLDRTSFMPGVALAIRKTRYMHGLVYGWENLL